MKAILTALAVLATTLVTGSCNKDEDSGDVDLENQPRIDDSVYEAIENQPRIDDPVLGARVVGEFGASRFFGGSVRTHEGRDYDCVAGIHEVRAVLPGTIIKSGIGQTTSAKRAGIMVEISHSEGGEICATRYMHLGSALPKVGDKVKANDVIGTCATSVPEQKKPTGHIHFEVIGALGQRLDPRSFMER